MTHSTREPEPGAVAVATLFGLGRIPRLPGTAGSLAAALLFLAFSRLLPGGSLLWAHLLWLGVLLPVSVWTSAAAVRVLGTSDPAPVVIDEALGQHLALLPLALPGAFEWKMWVAGFILFRAFDIAKPFPLRRVERWPGGWGVVADDILAGFYTAALLALLPYLG
ncbi:MAG: phosphatidylglycerophosphatase A [Terriglobia bacterium]